MKLNQKRIALMLAICTLTIFSAVCFASGDTLADSLDFTPIITSFTDKVTPVDIIKIVAMTITAGMLFVLAWFGIRKVVRALKSAIMKGKFNT